MADSSVPAVTLLYPHAAPPVSGAGGRIKAHLTDHDELVVAGTRYRMFNTMSLSYPLEPTLQILAGATGMDRHALVLRQAAIDKKALDKLVKEVAPERAHHYHDWTATASHHWLWLVMVRRAGCNRM